jgi:hypothetical protein
VQVAEKAFIYDDAFIQRRARERANRDVHLEEVLSHYFHRMGSGVSQMTRLNASYMFMQKPMTH